MAKWAGLGMCISPTSDNVSAVSDFFEEQMAELVSFGFTEVRLTCCNWNNTASIDRGKAAVALAVAAGLNVVWGVSGSGNVMTSSNWTAYSDKVLELAAWAEDNGVYEFQIGNEEEDFNDDDTLTDTQLRANLKTLATATQAVFSGNISYSVKFDAEYIDPWISVGKGDIDLLAINCYRGGLIFDDRWKTSITNMIAAFTASGTYISEFNLSGQGLSYYSENEYIQSLAINEMLYYIEASGMTRAMYFAYYDDMRPAAPVGFGALKTDKTYRLLWSVLTGSVFYMFSDGFESGDLTAWDSAATDGGDLSAHADAAIHGSYGLKCLFDDTTAIYVQDDTPSAETRYRARVYIDTTHLTMGDTEELVFVKPYMSAGSARVCQVGLKYYTATGYKVYAAIRTDAPGTSFTSEYAITNGTHCIEFDWKASTAAGANNGYIELLVDGVSKETKGSIDNDTYVVDFVLVGSANAAGAGTSGYLSIDSFASNDDGTLIGGLVEMSMSESITLSDDGTQTMAINMSGTEGITLSDSGIFYETDYPYTTRRVLRTGYHRSLN